MTRPLFECLGPGAAGVDPRLAVIALVRSEFKDFPLEKALVETHPGGQSLVNAATFASSSIDGRDVVERTILGFPVRVTAVATTYTWHFGDGTSVSTASQDSPPAEVQHTYRQAGAVAVSLDVDYRGTFTVGTSAEVYEADGVAHILGPTTGLVLREARSQLEGG